MKKHIFLYIVCALILSTACSLGGVKATATLPPPAPTQEPIVIPTSTVDVQPTVEQAAPTIEAIATEEPTEEPTQEPTVPPCPAFGREEFDEESPCWPSSLETVFIGSNVSNDLKIGVTIDDSQLQFQTSLPEDIYLYSFNTQNDYDEVILETSIIKIEPSVNQNGFALVCHVNEDGWYETRISSGGSYEIFQYDVFKKQNDENPYIFIASGGTPTIRIGAGRENLIRFECMEDELTLIINNKEVFYKQIKGMNSGGAIGLGLTSYSHKFPQKIGFDYIEIIQP
jgi:hypothetical protein